MTRVKEFLQQPSTSRLSEADTRAHFIDPIVAVLGYEGFEDITREYYVQNSQEHIDYVLRFGGKPAIAIEAKPLQTDLTAKFGAQLVQYCTVEGIEWCVLTNARELRLYNSHVPGDLGEKLVTTLDLLAFTGEADFDTIFSRLWLLSKPTKGHKVFCAPGWISGASIGASEPFSPMRHRVPFARCGQNCATAV